MYTDEQVRKLIRIAHAKGVAQQEKVCDKEDDDSILASVTKESNSIFLELAMRCRRELPTNEEEERWWNEQTVIRMCGDFRCRFDKEIERIRKTLEP